MRSDPLDIQAALASPEKEPRFVVGILYPTSSPYFTSRNGYVRQSIVNPGFERGDSSGWTELGSGPDAITTDEAYAGSYSMQLDGNSLQHGLYIDRPAVEGDIFRAKGWWLRDEAALPDADARIQVRYLDAALATLQTENIDADSTTAGWQQIDGEATAPALTAWVRIRVLARSALTTGTWYADSIEVFKFEGIANVPGVPVHGVLQNVSGSSQEIHPDEGRATIGTHEFSVVDADSAVTDELRDQLDSNDAGPRRREVRCFMGFTDDFDDYVRIWTEQLDDVQLVENVYQFTCADIQRQMRDAIFEPKSTRLTAALTDTATTITVDDTTDFETVAHTAAFSDAPSSTVGYIRIKKSGEIIRYTGKTATTFTGCTRGVFTTLARAVDVDTTKEVDKRPEVEEFIYLEMPGPELAYAVLTGVIRSSTSSPQDTLPDHWHLGIAESFVDGTAFDGIGLDLVDPADDTAGLVLRFTHLERWDGKQFLEEQIMLLMGCYMPINTSGVVGLRKFARILTNAPQVVDLNESNIVACSGLHHDQRSVINQIQVDWNYNGEDFTRRTFVQDQTSLTRNQDATVRTYQFRGLVISRHSDKTIERIVRTLADRNGEPPIRCQTTVLPSLSGLEVGDVVRQNLTRFRDYQGAGTLDRAFEAQGTQIDYRSGQVVLQLFGSGREVAAPAPAGSAAALPDNWYTGEGTELSTVLTISGGSVTVSGTLTGNTDLNAAGAIYYYDGDLTIDAGVVVSITANVQLRIRGTLTVNGDIDGVGGGVAGVASPNTVSAAVVNDSAQYLGTPGYFGTTRGGDGAIYRGGGGQTQWGFSILYTSAIGTHSAAPVLDLEVSGSLDSPPSATLAGIPTDCRGTSGGPGLAVQNPAGTVALDGGDGAASGAGLCIVCRGLAFGASGGIDLSGDNGNNGDNGAVAAYTAYAGSGSGGAPGAMYVLLDGNAVTYPDLGGKFVANRGSTPVPGTPGVNRNGLTILGQPLMGQNQGLPFANPATPTAENHADSAHQIQYVPVEAGLGDGDDDEFAPSGLAVTEIPNALLVTWTNPTPLSAWDHIEVWRSVDNNRSNAVLVGTSGGDRFIDGDVPNLDEDWFYWLRAIAPDGSRSEWHPLSSTAGVSNVPLTMGDQILYDPTFDRTDAAGGNADEKYWTDGLVSGPEWEDDGGEGGNSNAVVLEDDGTGNEGSIATTRRFALQSRLLHVTVRYQIDRLTDRGGGLPEPGLLAEITPFEMQKGGGLAATLSTVTARFEFPSAVVSESPRGWHTARFAIDLGSDFDSGQFQFCRFGLKASEGTLSSGDEVRVRVTTVQLIGSEGFAPSVSGSVVAPATQSGKILKDSGEFTSNVEEDDDGTLIATRARSGTIVTIRASATVPYIAWQDTDGGTDAKDFAMDYSNGTISARFWNEAWGSNEIAWQAIRNARFAMRYNNVEVARTVTAVNGGLEVNNTETGAGFERVLTESDQQPSTIKTTTQTSVSNTWQNDTHMQSMPLVDGQRYRVELYLEAECPSSTPDLQYRLNFTNTPADTGSWRSQLVDDNAGTHFIMEEDVTNGIGVPLVAARRTAVHVVGAFRANATTGGSVTLQWSQVTNTPASAVTLYTLSHMVLTPITN